MPLNKIGAFAEYTSIDKGEIALIPNYLSFKDTLTSMQAFE